MDSTTRVRVDLIGTLFLELAGIYRRRLNETVHDIEQRVAAVRGDRELEQRVQDYAIGGDTSDVIEQARATIGPAFSPLMESLKSIWTTANACADMLVHDLVREPGLALRPGDSDTVAVYACMLWDYREACGATGHPDGLAAWLHHEFGTWVESDSAVVRVDGRRRGPSHRHVRVLTMRRRA